MSKKGQKSLKIAPKMGNGGLPVRFMVWVQEVYLYISTSSMYVQSFMHVLWQPAPL